MVRAKLDFVAFFGRAVRARHYTGVVDQDVETRFRVVECGGCVGDGGERGEVEGEMDDFAALWDCIADVFDCGVGL